jgi:MerR family copper efflux transcriptional regulator
MSDGMNIGQASRASGVSAKMIRHYEEIGLIGQARRTAAGYRVYGEADLHTLRFIGQARSLGFSIEQIRDLLGLWHNQRRTSRKVKELALQHIAELDERIRELQQIRQTLSHLVQCCHGDSRPECPILDSLAQERKSRRAGAVQPDPRRHLTARKRAAQSRANPAGR